MPYPYRKILPQNSPGDLNHFGGNDYNILTLWHEDVDLTTGAWTETPYPSRVATPTEFRDDRLRLLNPMKTHIIRIRTTDFEEDYNLTIPLMKADDDLMLLALDQPIYNKTLSLEDNTVTSNTIQLGDLIGSDGAKYIRVPIGSPGQVLTVSSDGLNWSWADLPEAPEASGIPDDNSVSTIKIQNLAVTSAKIANSAITATQLASSAVTNAKIAALAVDATKIANLTITAAKIANATITNTQIADGTIANAKLAGSIVQDKLLQITDVGKLPPTILYDWSKVKRGALTLTTSDGGDGIWDNILTSTGTWTNYTTTSTNYRSRYTTTSTAGSQAGVRTNIPFTKPQFTNGPGGYALQGKMFWEGVQTDLYMFVGLVGGNPAFPAAGSGVSTWMNNLAGIGIWIDKPFSDSVRVQRNDGTAGSVGVDILNATAFSAGGNHTFTFTYNEVTPSWTITWDGIANTYTTEIPPLNQSLGLLCYVENTGAAVKDLEFAYLQTLCEAR